MCAAASNTDYLYPVISLGHLHLIFGLQSITVPRCALSNFPRYSMPTKLMSRRRRKNPASAGPGPLSALDKVTQTYELLEHILGFLDPHSLRQAHLANHYWHDIIHNSSELSARTKPAHSTARNMVLGAYSAGKEALLSSLLMGPSPDPVIRYDMRWEQRFRKELTVDGEAWVIEGCSNPTLNLTSYPGYLGQCLAKSDTYMLVYSAGSLHSFEEITRWLTKITSATEPLSMLVATRNERRKCTRSETRLDKCLPVAVVATDNELEASDKKVDPSQGAALARELGCAFYQTSAVTGEGIEAAFAEACRTYKRARMAEITERLKKTSRLAAVSTADPAAKERKERWWRWYDRRHKT